MQNKEAVTGQQKSAFNDFVNLNCAPATGKVVEHLRVGERVRIGPNKVRPQSGPNRNRQSIKIGDRAKSGVPGLFHSQELTREVSIGKCVNVHLETIAEGGDCPLR